MLSPKRTKFRKTHKGRIKGNAMRGNKLSFGELGLQAVGTGRMTARQIEAGRIAINRHMRRAGRVWIRVFPDRNITKKPAEVRMGKGKGAPDHWVAIIKPGRVLYELAGVDEGMGRRALQLAAAKLPFPTKIIAREEY